MKKYVPARIKKAVRWVERRCNALFSFVRRKMTKLVRFFLRPTYAHTYAFVIVCVKNTAYVELAIQNIHSLHLYNPTHTVTIHCDNICYEKFSHNTHRLDYPTQVTLENRYGNSTVPWQELKIKSLISASHDDAILMDADEVWHADPTIDKNKIIFQVAAYPVSSSPLQVKKSIFSDISHDEKWPSFQHYVTGLISIPSPYMTDELVGLIERNYQSIMNYAFDSAESEAEGFRRISEELAINIAVQTTYEPHMIAGIKPSDPKGDKHVLQSLYYGCANKVMN